MIHFKLFYRLVCRSHLDSQTIKFFTLGSWKKIFGALIQEKIIIPALFHSKAFVLLYKFETSWTLLGALGSRFFWPTQGSPNFTFHEPRSTLANCCDSYLVGFPLLYLAFFKTIWAVLFRTCGLPPCFLSLKPLFLYGHLTTQHSDFSIFSSNFFRDWSKSIGGGGVGRSIWKNGW